MKLNLYLPDDLGKAAKEAGLPLSAMLRRCVVEALEERKAICVMLDEIGASIRLSDVMAGHG